LTEVLVQNQRTRRGALLVVDEAQDLARDALEELRLLTNLQEHSTPLLQVFLVGQQGLRDVIRQRDMEQLHQRIIAACHIEPLAPDELRAYVEHRLVCVGWEGDPCISDAAYYIIHQFTDGVPRRINLVCSRLLLHGSVEEKHKLLARDVRVVLQELCDEHLDPAGSLGLAREIRDLVINSHLGIDDECSPAKPQKIVVTGNRQPSPQAQRAHATLENSNLPEDEASTEPMRATGSAKWQNIKRNLEEASAIAPVVVPVPESTAAPADSRAPVVGDDTPQSVLRRPSRRKWQRGTVFSILGVALSTLVIYAVAPEPMGRVRAHLVAGFKANAERLAAMLPAAKEHANGGGRAQVHGDDVPASESTVGKPSNPRPEPKVAAVRRGTEEETVRKGVAHGPGSDGNAKAHGFAQPLKLADKLEYQTKDLHPEEKLSTQRASAAATIRPGQSAQASPSETEPGGDSVEGPTTRRGEGPSTPSNERPLNPVATGKLKSTGSSRNGSDDRELEPLPGTAKAPAATKSIEALEKELRTYPLQVKRKSDDVIIVDLGREVLFAFDSTVIGTSSRGLLDRLARSLRRYADIGLRVVGHADAIGSEAYNVRLSRRRATAVANYLKQRGVQGLWIEAEGRGSSEPVAQSAGKDHRVNRRIELYIQAVAPG
jgi:outer membrane protein OmpA-like peptidoglycan-associated protein